MPSPITIASFGDLLDHGYGIWAWCETCQTSRPVDVRRIAEKLGRDTIYVGRRLPIRCATCGGRDCGITIQAPTAAAPISRSSS